MILKQQKISSLVVRLIVAYFLMISPTLAKVCDVNSDGNVDFQDIFRIQISDDGRLSNGLGDPRDADGNGVITNNDAQICKNRCSSAGCPGLVNIRPRAVNDSATTSLNQPVTINLLANDRDPGGRIVARKLRFLGKPKNGKVTNHRNGTVTYTPKPGYVGPDQFRYVVKDPRGSVSKAARVFITVNRFNLPPVANAGTDINAATGQAVILNGSQSSDPERALLSYAWRFQSVPATSTLTDASIANSQTVAPNFTPDVDGVYELALSVSDGFQANVDTVQIIATTANVPPNVDAGRDHNALVGFSDTFSGSATDPDNGPGALTYRWFFGTPLPTGSTLTDANILNPNTLTATFTPDVAGIYKLTLEANDGAAITQDEVLVTAAANTAPNANAGDDLIVPVNTVANLSGSGSLDPDSGPNPALAFTWDFVSLAPGSALVTGNITGANTVAPSFTPDIFGEYVVGLTAFDGDLSGVDQVKVKANAKPVAVNDSFTVVKDTVLNEALPGVLSNDTDSNLDPLTALVDTQPSHGTVVLNANGSFTYTPTLGFVSPPDDSFTYHVNDGSVNGVTPVANADSDVATVSITVKPPNAVPSFTKGADQTVLEDAGAQTVAGWATAIDDGDPEVQVLTFNATNDNAALFSVAPAVSPTGELTYTPAPNANGSATVTVTLQDDGGTLGGGDDTSDPQTFIINVTAVNDVPVFTKGTDQTVSEDAGAQTVASWATAIDDGDAEATANQTLTFNVAVTTNPGLFSTAPSVDASGTLTYTLAANANGTANGNCDAATRQWRHGQWRRDDTSDATNFYHYCQWR